MKVILFQGDSITDVSRIREQETDLGKGYASMVAANLGLSNPNDFVFYNRGISGNRIVDVYARIKADIINLKPDYVSILIGVNDVWHRFSRNNGVETAKFEKIYSMLLDEIYEALPGISIVLLEPFVLKGIKTEAFYDEFRREVEEKAACVRRLAEKYDIPFIPLQEDLDGLAQIAPADHWLIDGVHPTIYFHQYIANKWIDVFHGDQRSAKKEKEN